MDLITAGPSQSAAEHPPRSIASTSKRSTKHATVVTCDIQKFKLDPCIYQGAFSGIRNLASVAEGCE
jgi:hypothetical protein